MHHVSPRDWRNKVGEKKKDLRETLKMKAYEMRSEKMQGTGGIHLVDASARNTTIL